MPDGGDERTLLDLLSESLRVEAHTRQFASGDVIVREGEPGGSAFILLSGACAVEVHHHVVGGVTPGELFGDIACLEGGTRTATVRATAPSEVLDIAGDALRVELRRSPALLDRFLYVLSRRVRHISQRETLARDEHLELRRVLEGLHPSLEHFERSPHLSVEVRWQPLSFASGDYYDVLELSPTRVLFALGDVMGHGAPTAPIYGMVRGQLHEAASSDSQPHVLLTHLHRHMRQFGHPNVFMTLTLLIIDVESLTAEFAVAGPPSPLVYSGGFCGPLTNHPDWTLGYPFEGVVFHTTTRPLTHGDTFLFYTDGLSDARRGSGPDGDVLGIERLTNIFADLCAAGARGIADGIFREVEAFRGSWPVEDDATALVVRVR